MWRLPMNRLILALTPAACSLSVCPTLEYMRRFDPQYHSGFALKKGIFVATHVLSGEHVDVLGRSLVRTTLVDNGSADHNGPPRILRIGCSQYTFPPTLSLRLRSFALALMA